MLLKFATLPSYRRLTNGNPYRSMHINVAESLLFSNIIFVECDSEQTVMYK